MSDKRLSNGCFAKGREPFNKGKKWSDYMDEKVQAKIRKNLFKKGHITYNTRPVGSERIDAKDHYLYIKVAEPNKWQLKHRYLYEQKYGKIPKGYNLIFADGNKYNFDLDNLVLVSNAELLIMNKKGLYKKNKKLTKTGAIIAKVIDKSNKLKSRR